MFSGHGTKLKLAAARSSEDLGAIGADQHGAERSGAERQPWWFLEGQMAANTSQVPDTAGVLPAAVYIQVWKTEFPCGEKDEVNSHPVHRWGRRT